MSLVFNGNSTIDNIVFNGYDVEHLIYNGVEVWSKGGHDYSKDHLTIEALEAGTLKINRGNYGSAKFYYSINNGAWQSFTTSLSAGGLSFSVAAGDVVRFYRTETTRLNTATDTYHYFGLNFKCKAYGNIMSLCGGNADGPGTTNTFDGSFAFYRLFYSCSGLVDASNLILPVESLTDDCYNRMFYGCNYLTAAPKLPATTLATRCYTYMFYSCANLENAPELKATTLKQRCYDHMFANCIKLETAPLLPASTLISYCYNQLFNGCTKLKYIKCLATSSITTTNCSNWVTGVASTGTFVKHTNASWGTGNSAIPSGWTVETASS